MSMNARTTEEMTIHNVNSKTALVAKELGEYLIKTWGITKLSLTVDDIHYEEFTNGEIKEGTELHSLCQRLGERSDIFLHLESDNAGGPSWRLNSCFMKELTDDEDLKRNIIYRSTDIFDTDSCVMMYLYNDKGLQEPDYKNSFDDVSDIKEWFSYTPTLIIENKNHPENVGLYKELWPIFVELYSQCFGINADELNDSIENEYEHYGMINGMTGIIFSGKDIHRITDLLNRLYDLIKNVEGITMECAICAIPHSKDDYPFASIVFTLEDGRIIPLYCRY